MKKETLEEFAERMSIGVIEDDYKDGIIEGAKWQQEQNDLRLKHSEALLSNCEKTLEKKIKQERSYSEEEALNLLTHFAVEIQRQNKRGQDPIEIKIWFERNKEKFKYK